MTTTGQNISNANTVGFSRQTAVQSAAEPSFSGGGYLGAGVNVEAVKRSYSAYLTAQVQSSQAQAARASTYAEGMAQINGLVGDPNRSPSIAVADFFATVQQVTTNPGDAASRQSMMASAQTLVQRFNALADGLSGQRRQINDELSIALGDVNSQSQQIADLNSRIAGETAAGRSPNDLLDQRDQVIATLNSTIRANAVVQGDGTVNLYLANGQALVTSGVVQKLAISKNAINPDAPNVGLQSGQEVISLSGGLDLGGRIGGLLALRDDALASAEAGVGRLARVIAETVNAQNRLGQDLRGNSGADLFAVNDPFTTASPANKGNASATVSIANASQLAPSDYRVSYADQGVVVTRISDGTQSSFAGSPISIDGLNIELSGSGSVGDTFLVTSASGAAGSLRMAGTDTARIATGLAVGVSKGSDNKGDAVASIAVNSNDAALRNAATLVFDGNGSVTVTSGGGTTTLAYTDGSAISLNGWSVTLQGSPKAGDTFSVGPSTNASGDNRNVNVMAGLAGQNVVDGTTFAGAFGQLVAALGARGREAELTKSATQSLAADAGKSRDSVAGVNLDEEAMSMMRYQQAYQAAGKLVSISNTLFDAILQASR